MYHNLKLDENSSCLTTLICPFCGYRYLRVPFRAALGGDIFQKKIDILFNGMPNGFCIAYDILIAGFDEWGKDQNLTLGTVLQACMQMNLKFSKDKHLVRCTGNPFFGEVISCQDGSLDPRKIKALADMLSTKTKRKCSCS